MPQWQPATSERRPFATSCPRVGTEYPKPRIDDGKRMLWMRDDLDKAIGDPEMFEEDASDLF